MTVQESFVARAESLLNRLAQLADAEADASASHTIAATNKRVSEVIDGLTKVDIARAELASRQIVVPRPTSKSRTEAGRARGTLRTAATTSVGANAKDLAQRLNTTSMDAAVATAENLLRASLVDLNKAVDAKRKELLPPDIERIIPNYPGAPVALTTRLEVIQRRLRGTIQNREPAELVAIVPELHQDVLDWTKGVLTLDEGMVRLHPDIQAFVRAVASPDGAAWSLVTPTVAAWLEDPDNHGGLRIRQA